MRTCSQETPLLLTANFHLMKLLCSEELADHAILSQVNCACFLKDELEKEQDKEDIAGQERLAVEADEHLIPLTHGHAQVL